MNLATVRMHKDKGSILVCIFGYPRSWDYTLPTRPIQPQRRPTVIKFPRGFLPCSWVREHSASINTTGTDGDCRCPPWATTPYLRLRTPIPHAQKYSNCQQHPYRHTNRDSDDQTLRNPLHSPHSARDPSTWGVASTSWKLQPGRRPTAISILPRSTVQNSKLEALNCEGMWLHTLGGCLGQHQEMEMQTMGRDLGDHTLQQVKTISSQTLPSQLMSHQNIRPLTTTVTALIRQCTYSL